MPSGTRNKTPRKKWKLEKVFLIFSTQNPKIKIQIIKSVKTKMLKRTSKKPEIWIFRVSQQTQQSHQH